MLNPSALYIELLINSPFDAELQFIIELGIRRVRVYDVIYLIFFNLNLKKNKSNKKKMLIMKS